MYMYITFIRSFFIRSYNVNHHHLKKKLLKSTRISKFSTVYNKNKVVFKNQAKRNISIS